MSEFPHSILEAINRNCLSEQANGPFPSSTLTEKKLFENKYTIIFLSSKKK